MFFRRRPDLEAAPDIEEPEEAPPPSPSDRARNPIVVIGDGIFTALLLLALGGGGLIWWGKSAFQAPGPLPENRIVNVMRGNLDEVAEQLDLAGVIERPIVFQAGIWASDARNKVKAGEYEFPARVSMRGVMDILVEGKSIEHTVTIPEGLTSEQIVGRLMSDDTLIGEVRQVPREGTLLPETYKFQRGTSREQLLARMTEAQRKALADVWAQRAGNLPIRSPQELVVLASIVEKETGQADERPRVAAVFSNRLVKRMRLQSDPTIIYGIVAGKGTLGRSLTRTDIDTRTPYNTYTIDGLPPGPIANPGLASLRAAANPATTRDVYFVADGTGGHAFAETLADHNRNVARWRAIERSNASGAPDAAPAAQN